MTEHVLQLAAADHAALATVRHLPGLQAAAAPDGSVWLRGLPATSELPLALRQLPAQAAYLLDAQNRLFPSGRATPTAQLPALSWLPIAAFVLLALPTAALPGQGVPTYHVRLVPARHAAPGIGLLTTLAHWHKYADTAPEIRLQALRFAAAADGRVLLLGNPLPPLPGQEFWQQGSLLLPAGFDFEAALVGELLAQQLPVAPGELLLFAADGRWERLVPADFLPATRGAVRRTAKALLRDE